jgi:hypothetical protein
MNTHISRWCDVHHINMEIYVNFMKINDISNVQCVLKGGKKREKDKTEQK